jgi:tetratricopeptide (TPR) repeat protein
MIPESKRYVLGAKLNSYLGNYEDAVEVLNEGIEENPESPHLYRHRGHFKISLRRFEESIPDFETAIELMEDVDDEIEYYRAELVPEMERVLLGKDPELLDEPTPITDATLEELRDVYKGTLKSSTWYHYGLAHYLVGEFDSAADCYENTLPHCVDDDMRVATQDWRYMSLRRAGREDEAERLLDEIDTESMHVNEDSYLERMQLYKGEAKPSDLLTDSSDVGHAPATKGYGVGNWYLYNGEKDRAVEVFADILEGDRTRAFGYIAAEVDVQRLGE